MMLSIILMPLLGFLLVSFFGRNIGHKYVGLLTSIGIAWSALGSWICFFRVIKSGCFDLIYCFDWLTSSYFTVSWYMIFDSITCVMLIVVTSVSCLVHFYSINYMSEDPHFARFMSYLSLFTFFMLMLVTAGNYLQMFVGWEGVGICSYLLVNFWYTRIQANKSAIKAVVLNRIGDFGIGLALVALFFEFGTLDYGVIFSLVPYVNNSLINFFFFEVDKLNLISLLLFLGAVGKSAQIGLHTWLPDAMEGPTPVSALIHAATMVTAGVFVLIRSSPILEYCPQSLIFVSFFGALTAFFAATAGVVQNDLKRVIAYSTCSQLGYMVFISGLSQYSLSLFHLTNHAFFKALLFLSAGIIIHGFLDEQDMRKMGGLINLLPVAYVMIFVGSLSLMGFPFLTGFYSKDIILEYTFSRYSNLGIFCYWLGVLAAFFTAFYSMRLIYLTFYSKPNGYKINYFFIHDAKDWMLLSVSLLFFGSVFFGYIFKDLFIGLGSDFFNGSVLILPKSSSMVESEFLSVSIKMIPLYFSILGFGVSFLILHFLRSFHLNFLRNTNLGYFFYSFLVKKWFFDLLYNALIARGVLWFGYHVTFKIVDRGILEVFGPSGISLLVYKLAETVSKVQSGYLYHYIFIMILAFVIYFSIFYFLFAILWWIKYLTLFLILQFVGKDWVILEQQ